MFYFLRQGYEGQRKLRPCVARGYAGGTGVGGGRQALAAAEEFGGAQRGWSGCGGDLIRQLQHIRGPPFGKNCQDHRSGRWPRVSGRAVCFEGGDEVGRDVLRWPALDLPAFHHEHEAALLEEADRW